MSYVWETVVAERIITLGMSWKSASQAQDPAEGASVNTGNKPGNKIRNDHKVLMHRE